MKTKRLRLRISIIFIVTLASLYIIAGPRRLPTPSDFSFSGIKRSLAENINLGTDLRGGTRLVMRVMTEEYLKRLTDNNAVVVQSTVRSAEIAVGEARAYTSGGTYRIVLESSDPTKIDEIIELVKKKVELADWPASVSGNSITWTLNPAAQRILSDQAVEEARRIIDLRINAVGITEAYTQRHGSQSSHQLLLEMPGIQDPERVKALIAGTSRLDLVHVISPPSPSPVQTYASEEEAVASLGGGTPANRRVLPFVQRSEGATGEGQSAQKRWVVVENPPVIDGSELRNASAVNSSGVSDDYRIAFTLKPSGAEKFGRWTGANVNEYMGIVLNEEVRSIAYIKSQITDSGKIEGRFTKETAVDIALTLNSGALPASIRYEEERTVGPSLGADSIRAGIKACLAGLALVVGFMLFYYRGAGVNAVFALLLNLILILAGLVIFGAALTLPGIAGIVLTIGMGVDSNVLIFERIREELRTGKTVRSAVEQGYTRALVTIIDTHVTTIISSLFLYVFGTGLIRGFAVTLVLGLACNLFSAVYVSHTIFIWLLNRKGGRAESLSI